ncbi:MAG TPA: CRISPR-associated endonuclease Cas2 [Methanospirillum sp.]|nr:CRISPR-associated endonuclease Cas2 [Methanospirillum sp.]
MVTWVMYDITDNKIRNKVAQSCLDYGLIRFQKSIFCGEPDKKTLEVLRTRISEQVGTKEEGSAEVFVFTICDTCMKNRTFIGTDSEPMIVHQPRLIIIG